MKCGSNWYYVSFVEMYSHFTWIYLIRKKSQAVDCFIRFQYMVKVQFGKDIKQVQSDWGLSIGRSLPFCLSKVFCIALRAYTLRSKMEFLNVNIDILSRLDLQCWPKQNCPYGFGVMHLLVQCT